MMPPPAYCEPIENEECCELSETWSTPLIVKELEWKREFIDWDTRERMIWYAEDESAPVSTLSKVLELIETWRDETQNVSSLTSMISHPAYQEIIDTGVRLGKPVITTVLMDFRQNGGYWATALHAMTGKNPVAIGHLGNPKKIREDWLNWGKMNGYL
jgi:hypothetical protein